MLELVLRRGGSAVVLQTDGDLVTVLSSLPSPPGSTLELVLGEVEYRIKVRGCRRSGNETDAQGRAFRIEGRWVNLSKPDRERILGGN